MDCHTSVNPDSLKKLDDICERFFSWLKFDISKIDITYNVLDYPKDHGFDAGKTKKYFDNIYKFLNDSTYVDLNGTFVHIMKTGEIYVIDSVPTTINGYLLNRSDRPRGIHAGNNSSCGIFAGL